MFYGEGGFFYLEVEEDISVVKIKHKHSYQKCIFKSVDRYRDSVSILQMGYCEICGKVREYPSFGNSYVCDTEYAVGLEQRLLEEHPGVRVIETEDVMRVKYVEVSGDSEVV